jgi:hypothetical protein
MKKIIFTVAVFVASTVTFANEVEVSNGGSSINQEMIDKHFQEAMNHFKSTIGYVDYKQHFIDIDNHINETIDQMIWEEKIQEYYNEGIKRIKKVES